MACIKVTNFRQLAGIPSSDGRKVKNNLFFRGAPFIDLDVETRNELNKIGFKHIVDLRSEEEAKIKVVNFVPKGCDYIQISANRLSHERRANNLDFSDNRNNDDIENWLKQAYRYFPFSNQAYQKVFAYLKEGQVPIYFHCACGKDRTGACAALILYMLDVDLSYIFEDYLKSYAEMKKLIKEPSRTALVFKEWLEGSFEEIEKKYASRDDYFLKEFGINKLMREQLKDLYLE